MAMHWYCARCGEEVDFEDQMRFYIFDGKWIETGGTTSLPNADAGF